MYEDDDVILCTLYPNIAGFDAIAWEIKNSPGSTLNLRFS